VDVSPQLYLMNPSFNQINTPFNNVGGRYKLSVDKIAMLCIAMLVYTMGKFQLMDILGIKRVVQFILIIPVLFYCIFRIENTKIGRQLNLLMAFITSMLVVKILLNPDVAWIADYLFSMIGIFAVSSVSSENICWLVKCIVMLALCFALMAMLQFALLLLFPSFIPVLQVGIENGNLVVLNTDTLNGIAASFHPLMLFGLLSPEILDVFGLYFPRMRSFTSEPSLLVAFFLLPAALGLLLNERRWAIASGIIVFFCLSSFSGSVQISIAFSMIYIIASFFFASRFIFISLPVLSAIVILFLFVTTGGEWFVLFDATLGNSSPVGFLSKGNSLVVRGQGLVDGFQEAIRSPLGSAWQRSLPLPIILSAMLSAGWFGAFLLLLFFLKLIVAIDINGKKHDCTIYHRTSFALFFGVFCTIFTFNDYAMLNYSGLILLFLYYNCVKMGIKKNRN
jgi:hypothetical protein